MMTSSKRGGVGVGVGVGGGGGGVTADSSTLRIAIGLYPISDNCVRE